MTLKIYVDVLFIINFIMDYILLSVTSFFIKQPSVLYKKFVAAGIGALFASVVFFLPIETLYMIPLSVLVSLVMVSCTFGIRKGIVLFRHLATFYAISFVGAGASFTALFFGNKYIGTSYAIKKGIVYADLPAYTIFAAFLCAIAIMYFACGYIKKVRIKSRYLYDVTIKKDGKSVTEQALFDTGNFLSEPLSQRSVLIAEWDAISTLFGTDTLAEAIAKTPGEFLYIPLKSVNGKTGVFAFCPDEIISGEVMLHESAYVGISETPLDTDGSYRMILPNTASIVERT